MNTKEQARYDRYVKTADTIAAATTTAQKRKALLAADYDLTGVTTGDDIAEMAAYAVQSLRHQARATKSTAKRRETAAASAKKSKRNRAA